jgi:hypothetical protein
MILSESLIDSVESSDQQGVLTKEEDQRNILIIGGINIFLPSSLIEANAHDEGATEERQSSKSVMKEEHDHKLASVEEMREEEEHSAELIKIFNKGDEQEITAELGPETEERAADNMDLVDLYEKFETLIERKLSEEIAKKQLSKIVVEMEFAVEWKANATRYEINMGD